MTIADIRRSKLLLARGCGPGDVPGPPKEDVPQMVALQPSVFVVGARIGTRMRSRVPSLRILSRVAITLAVANSHARSRRGSAFTS
jgi:hypothetical protein